MVFLLTLSKAFSDFCIVQSFSEVDPYVMSRSSNTIEDVRLDFFRLREIYVG